MSNNDEYILKVEHLKQYFPVKKGFKKTMLKAVDDVSFDIYKGETVSLVGESGSGKTTIGRAVVRVNPCSAGYIRFKNDIINGKLNSQEYSELKTFIDNSLA